MSSLSANLASQLVDGSLPWDRSTQMHIDDFLKAYTLHDSYWIGMLVECWLMDTTIAAFIFDPVWNSSVSPATSLVGNWPKLFLRFSCVNTISLSGFSDVGRWARSVGDVAVRHISDEEVVTEISDVYGASISLKHFPLINILFMSSDEAVIDLDTLSK